MKRIILSVGILVVFCAAMLYSSFQIKNTCDICMKRLDEIYQSVSDENYPQAEEAVRALTEKWESRAIFFMLLLGERETQDADRCLALLKSAVKGAGKENILSLTRAARQMLLEIQEKV